MTTTGIRERDSALQTQRLILRAIAASDAPAVQRLAGDWQVARMMADMPHPMGPDTAVKWTQAAVSDHSLAITLQGEMIGSVSVCVLDEPPLDVLASEPAAELGFWLGRPWWGYGYAREAAGAVVRGFLSEGVIVQFQSGHFADNPASGRVLSSLGFVQTGTTQQWCLSRQQTLTAIRYRLSDAGEAGKQGTAAAKRDRE